MPACSSPLSDPPFRTDRCAWYRCNPFVRIVAEIAATQSDEEVTLAILDRRSADNRGRSYRFVAEVAHVTEAIVMHEER